MGFDNLVGRKTMLYADLFKPRGQNLTQKCEDWSASSSNFDSSSSFGSELESSESEDGDFVAELSRQMAECMLQEDDEMNNSVTDSAPVWDADRNRDSCPELKNQRPVISKRAPVSRVKGGELTQQTQFQKTERNYGRYREGNMRNGQVGSGMRAVFLGGSKSRNGPSGTGVFLPRAAKDSAELQKKSGLSTVLIPTRVLDALELHFNRLSDSAALPHLASPRDEWSKSKRQGNNRRPNFQNWAANKDEEETQILPQEWTY